MDDFI